MMAITVDLEDYRTWFCTTFRLTTTTSNGKTYLLPRKSFEPYNSDKTVTYRAAVP